MIYLNDLAKLPPFESCVAIIVAKDRAIGEDVLLDVISIITPLSDYATTYVGLWKPLTNG